VGSAVEADPDRTRSWHEERLYVDGNLVEAEGGAVYDNIDPSNENTLGVAADAYALVGPCLGRLATEHTDLPLACSTSWHRR